VRMMHEQEQEHGAVDVYDECDPMPTYLFLSLEGQVRMIHEHGTGQSRGFCFVDFAAVTEAARVLREAQVACRPAAAATSPHCDCGTCNSVPVGGPLPAAPLCLGRSYRPRGHRVHSALCPHQSAPCPYFSRCALSRSLRTGPKLRPDDSQGVVIDGQPTRLAFARPKDAMTGPGDRGSGSSRGGGLGSLAVEQARAMASGQVRRPLIAPREAAAPRRAGRIAYLPHTDRRATLADLPRSYLPRTGRTAYLRIAVRRAVPQEATRGGAGVRDAEQRAGGVRARRAVRVVLPRRDGLLLRRLHLPLLLPRHPEILPVSPRLHPSSPPHPSCAPSPPGCLVSDGGDGGGRRVAGTTTRGSSTSSTRAPASPSLPRPVC
jgi:hypothetical protein